jgi:hypothetical protein
MSTQSPTTPITALCPIPPPWSKQHAKDETPSCAAPRRRTGARARRGCTRGRLYQSNTAVAAEEEGDAGGCGGDRERDVLESACGPARGAGCPVGDARDRARAARAGVADGRSLPWATPAAGCAVAASLSLSLSPSPSLSRAHAGRPVPPSLGCWSPLDSGRDWARDAERGERM